MRARVLLVLLALAGPALALDPKRAITQYVHETWRVDQGLPTNDVTSITQSHDGYLWLTGLGGLVRFDGVRFTRFVCEKGGPDDGGVDDANFAFEDREGALWVGAQMGVARLKDGKYVQMAGKLFGGKRPVQHILEDREGNFWFSLAGKGLARFRDGKVTSFPEPADALLEDRRGDVWVGTKDGLSRFRDGRSVSFSTRDGLSAGWVHSLLEDRSGDLWIGTGHGLNRLRDGKFTVLTTKDGLSSDEINALLEDCDGNLWIGTGNGLDRFRDGVFTAFTRKDGLSGDAVTSLFEDREGSLWIGTRDGLDRLREGKFLVYTTREGLSTDAVYCPAEDRDRTLWIATLNGLNRLKDGQVTPLTAKDGFVDGGFGPLCLGHEGSLWFVSGEALYRFKDGRLTSLTKQDGLVLANPVTVYEGRTGVLWIGMDSRSGLARVADGRVTTYDTSQLGGTVQSIFEDREGTLWLGMYQGLSTLQDGKITRITPQEDRALSQAYVWWFLEDQAGTLWIATGRGLFRRKGGRFTSFTTEQGLLVDNVQSIVDDGLGGFWLTTNFGPFRVSRKELEEVAAGKRERVTSVLYSTADGLKNPEAALGSLRTQDGRLWFPTAGGLAVIDPAHIPTNRIAPPVIVEEVLVDGRTLERTTRRCPPGAGKLEVRYTANSFVVPKKVRFKTRLDGFDRDWVDAGTERVAHYTNLPPRDYTFRVKACNDDGLWNETGASFAFTLLPHFWQTWWFHGLEGIAALCALAGAFVVQRRRVEARADHARKTEELEEARRVQLGLVPTQPLAFGDLTVCGRMETATEVGGDYFDYLVAGERLCVVVADATGHGTSSGLVAGMLKSALATLSQRVTRADGPSLWLEELNGALRTSIARRGLGVCAALALVDGETGELELASAGIPNPFLVRAAGAIERLPLSGAPLGYLRRITVASALAKVEPGDRVVLLTDGLLEQGNAAGDEWGYAGVEAALSRVGAWAPPRDVVDAILVACEAHAAGATRSDDRTVVVVARRPASEVEERPGGGVAAERQPSGAGMHDVTLRRASSDVPAERADSRSHLDPGGGGRLHLHGNEPLPRGADATGHGGAPRADDWTVVVLEWREPA